MATGRRPHRTPLAGDFGLDRLPVSGGGVARRLEGTGVSANSLHPGVVRTNFGGEDQAWFFSVISRVARPLLKTPARGALTSIYLASSPEMDGVTGKYFVNRQPRAASKLAYNTTSPPGYGGSAPTWSA
jgi:hypothetical protein